MAHQTSEHYDDRRASITAFLGAVLMCAGIVGLFLFITWLTYATD